MPDRRGVWRRWWPVAMFWVVIALAFGIAFSGVLNPLLLVGPLVGAYIVARYGPRGHLWVAWFPVVPFTIGWVWNDGPWWDAIGLDVAFVACLLLGLTIRTRRDYLAALVERAGLLERERSQQAELAAAGERARIAREMHDIVAHNLAVIVALADGAVASAAVPARSRDLMSKVAVTGREALIEVRQLVGVLRDDLAPAVQLDGLVEHVRAAGLPVTLHREGTPGSWGPGVDLTVYRIVQEALTNTMKHAGPSAAATVSLRYDSGGVDVVVVDDGGGRAAAPANGGHGLTGMRERAASYGGALVAGPVVGGGWRVNARLTVRS